MNAANPALSETSEPWYRHRWPWLLMSGPAIVVVAGFYTAYLAVRTDDGVVADDYYKRGLEVNQELRRGQAAAALGLAASLALEDGWVKVRLTGASGSPGALQLSLVHPTRSGADQLLRLARLPDQEGAGVYGARLELLGTGARRVVLEDVESRWRLNGELPAGAKDARLSPRP